MIGEVEKAQAGDGEAFTGLMEAYTPYMYKIARGFFREEMEIEDAMGQTVLDCWAKLDTLKKPEYFKTWLTRILINNCNDILRKKVRFVSLREIPELDAPEMETSDLFEEMMGCLSDRVRPVMQLYYGEEWKVEEIARCLHIPVGTVSTRLRQGRRQIERILRERGYTE